MIGPLLRPPSQRSLFFPAFVRLLKASDLTLLGSQLELFVCFSENWLDITAILNRLRIDAALVPLAIAGIRNIETAS